LQAGKYPPSPRLRKDAVIPALKKIISAFENPITVFNELNIDMSSREDVIEVEVLRTRWGEIKKLKLSLQVAL